MKTNNSGSTYLRNIPIFSDLSDLQLLQIQAKTVDQLEALTS